MGNNNTKTYIYLLFAMICWGLSFIWYKQALVKFPPVTLVITRLIISFPLLLIFSISLKRLKKIKKADLPYFFLLAFFEPFLYFLGESNGMQFVSPTVASIIIATIPIFTSIVAYFFMNEKLNIFNYVGMALSFLGVVAVIYFDNSMFEATGKGILLMFLAVFAANVYGFIIKRIAENYNTLTVVTAQNIIAFVYLIPVFFIRDFQVVKQTSYTFQSFIPVIYLSVFASTLAYVGFIQGMKVLGVAKATIFTNFIPVFTAVFAFIILGEDVTLLQIAGILLVVLGLVISQRTIGIKKKNEETILDELY